MFASHILIVENILDRLLLIFTWPLSRHTLTYNLKHFSHDRIQLGEKNYAAGNECIMRSVICCRNWVTPQHTSGVNFFSPESKESRWRVSSFSRARCLRYSGCRQEQKLPGKFNPRVCYEKLYYMSSSGGFTIRAACTWCTESISLKLFWASEFMETENYI